MTKRLKLTFGDGEWRAVGELLKRRFPYLPPSTSAKLILMELSENTTAPAPSGTRGDSEALAVTDSHPEAPQVTCPTPARASDPDPDLKREEKKSKSKKSKTPPVAGEVFERIVSDLNEQTGGTARSNGKAIRAMIAARLHDGWTEADFIEVHRKKAKEWKDDPEMARYLVFGTLYRPSNFEKYLGQPEVGPKRRGGGPVPQSEKQDYTEGVNPDGTW